MRHGESEWNVEGRIQGQRSGVPLTARGRAQAHAAASQLMAQSVDRIVSSDLERARATAAIIADALARPVEFTPALREQALGSLEGRLASELAAEPVPDGVDITEVRWGGGESVADVHARLRAFVAAVEQDTVRGTVLVVAHEGTIQVLRAVLAGRGHRDVAWDRVTPGEIVDLDTQPGCGNESRTPVGSS